MSSESFARFVAPFLTRSRVLQAVEWIPRVTPRDREAFEARARAWAPGFQITERSATNRRFAFGHFAALAAVGGLACFPGAKGLVE